MKTIIFRLGTVLAVTATGILLLACITFVGEKSSGPIEGLMSSIGNTVTSLETKYIMAQRGESRSQTLVWLNKYKSDREQLTNPTTMFLGAYDNNAQENYKAIVSFEDSIETVLPLIHFFTAWGGNRDQKFPSSQVNSISALGSIPLITWEPWLADFDQKSFPGIAPAESRDVENLKSIASGAYDTYIDQWANDAKASGQVMFVRFGHEMNDPFRYPWGPQNNAPADFVASWQHVVTRFREQGADNVIWVWSPHPTYGDFQAYYPGDEFVDWVGTGILNYGTVAPWSQWESFDDKFANQYDELAEFNKPIMIAEFGSLSIGGDKSTWFKDALTDFPVKYPAVKSLVFFHDSSDATTTYQALNWYIKNDPSVVRELVAAINNWKDMPGSVAEKKDRLTYTRANDNITNN